MDFEFQLAVNCTEAFFLASGLGCVLTDGSGTVLHERGQNYTQCRLCALAGSDPQRCLQTHRYGLQEAKRFGGKYIYYCHMGLTCFTTPIWGERGAEAQITAGPFLMGDVQDYIACDLFELSAHDPEQLPQVVEEVSRVPQVDEKRVNALAELLFMSTAFLNKVSAANRMRENEESVRIQGQISGYLSRLKQSDTPLPYPYREEKRFLQTLGKGDPKHTQQMLTELLGHILFETGGNVQRIQDRIHELLILCSRTVIEAGGDPVCVDQLLQQYREYMSGAHTVDELSLWICRAVQSLMSAAFSNQTARHSDLIYRTIQYLKTNYMHKLNLDEIAHHVHISPTYLSRIFKRETGSSLVDFLNQIRIEKSRELLLNPEIRLIEVALQSGFESQSYFNRLFRQETGMTPQEYRKLMTAQ